jgi:uracil phosphoribosyltransferase
MLPNAMPLIIVSHPLVDSLLTEMRDVNTQPARFRRHCHRITTLLAVEALRQLPTKPQMVETPIEMHEGRALATGVVVVPVLRAGLGMVDPILALVPHAQVGHVGIERDHTTALPRSYYSKIPQLGEQHILVVDPMLATGGTALHAIRSLRQAGGKYITLVAIVAAPEGVDAVSNVEPDVPIYTASLDRCLNEHKYIVPGLGDFGDRLMGTI